MTVAASIEPDACAACGARPVVTFYRTGQCMIECSRPGCDQAEVVIVWDDGLPRERAVQLWNDVQRRIRLAPR